MLASACLFHANSNPLRRRAYDNLLQMLQSSMRPQLAGISNIILHLSSSRHCQSIRHFMNSTAMGPTDVILKAVQSEMDILGSKGKHWYCGGLRSTSVAANLLKRGWVIAVPTDTIYGLVGLAQNERSVKEIYKIKRRNDGKPLAICIPEVSDIPEWGVSSHLPQNLLQMLLPGPVTVVLERTPKLNPSFNPGNPTVGIRIPSYNFIRCVSAMCGQPVALTSANESGQGSTLDPQEFRSLWPQLGGIFYAVPHEKFQHDMYRQGSSVIDLTVPGKYKVLRKGVFWQQTLNILQKFDFQEIEVEEENSVDKNIEIR